VSKDIEGLPKLYKKTRKEIGVGGHKGYCSTVWIWTIGEFLDISFPGWAHENKIIWGNNFGSWVNQKKRAFGKKEDETLTNNDIIIVVFFPTIANLHGVKFCVALLVQVFEQGF
jgi:hypothetical protein